jgi:hypothetical protein
MAAWYRWAAVGRQRPCLGPVSSAATSMRRASGGADAIPTPPCDGCGKTVGTAWFTDDEVCGGSDGPGFYLWLPGRRQRLPAVQYDMDVIVETPRILAIVPSHMTAVSYLHHGHTSPITHSFPPRLPSGLLVMARLLHYLQP